MTLAHTDGDAHDFAVSTIHKLCGSADEHVVSSLAASDGTMLVTLALTLTLTLVVPDGAMLVTLVLILIPTLTLMLAASDGTMLVLIGELSGSLSLSLTFT